MGSSIAMIGMIVLSAGLFETPPPPPKGTTRTQEERFARARGLMVQRQIAARGISDSAVLDAMRSVPRHLFVAESHRGEAYEDYPLPIGQGQTISQPFIVAAMTDALALSSK